MLEVGTEGFHREQPSLTLLPVQPYNTAYDEYYQGRAPAPA
ncbi:MAG TPA: hypothetical protein VLA19_04800 [Herpetosiphonaceae bacterium]|nr:hypothetical protein [Herpetosiphonaceae bacterium]